MKSLKGETLVGIVLIVVLSFYGWRLEKNARFFIKWPAKEEAAARSNNALAFESAGGFDVRGRPVNSNLTSQPKRTIAFLLRSVTIREDLDFWRRVQSAISHEPEMRLVGYCDGDECADAVRHELRVSDFPVILYGEVISSQALVNSDLEGYALVSIQGKSQPKRIRWRVASRTPTKTVEEALR